MDTNNQEEERKLSKDELKHKLATSIEYKKQYEDYQDLIESTGESQISLTDPDSRLMKQNEGFCVGYNIQTAVDAESHLVAGFKAINNPTDHRQITYISPQVRKEYTTGILEITANKGYECPENHADALAYGIIPNVIQRNGACTEEVTFDYKDADITDGQKASCRPEDLHVCLEAEVIPDTYNGILTNREIIEVKKRMLSTTDSVVLSMSQHEMRAKVLEVFFVRDAARNLVYCPQSEILR